MHALYRLTGIPALLVALTVLFGPAPSALHAQPVAGDTTAYDLSPDAAVPLDPNVRVGTLDNGVRYYIRHNEEPQNRAELRLAIDAGSLLEDESQLGLAHFTEHMLFNGTRRFEKQELVDFLERTGMRFGPDVNAYTSFDETVYMLTIPTDSADIVTRSFDVLEDWAGFATLDPEEIDKERGVVLEEWRARDQNAQGRITEQLLPVLLHDSRYAERLPIGDTTILLNADYGEFERYYKNWYRPELMAVVAVGDFDVDAIEAMIRERFERLTPPENPPARTTYEVPGHEETLYAIITDPEYPYSTVSVYYKHDAEEYLTVDQYRDLIVGRLFTSLLNQRYEELARSPSPPFVGASVSRGNFVRAAGFYSIGAQVQDDSLLVGLEAVLSEAARVREHGFTESELERAKQNMLRGYERAYNERNNTNSSSFAGEYVAYFLEDEPTPGIAYEYALVQKLMPEITTEEVNELAADYLAEQNRVVTVVMPEKPDLTPPTEAELAAVFDAVDSMELASYEDTASDAPLLETVPEPAAVAETETVSELGITRLTFPNGVVVNMKPTDFKEDEVQFTATSPGGTSLVDDAQVFDADYATYLVSQSGVGTFSELDLEKRLAGQVVNVSPYIGELEEGLNGSASPDDLETLFQLIHLHFTQPRADQDALSTFKNQMRAFLTNRSTQPEAAFQDSLRVRLYGDHPRRQFPTIEQVESLDLDAALAIYKDRFADAGDFVFTFSGNFDVDELTRLAQTYLGTLPGTGREETWRDVYPEIPDGLIEVDVNRGIGDRSTVLLRFHGPFDYNRITRHQFRTLTEVLQIKLREDLREDRGGVYGVSVQGTPTDRPEPGYTLSINFVCDPARVDELVGAVFNQIHQLKENGPTADDLAKVKEQQRRQRETQKETNNFWVSVIDFYDTHEGEDLMDVLTYEDMIESITPAEVKAAAEQYLNEERYIEGVLYPENFDRSVSPPAQPDQD